MLRVEEVTTVARLSELRGPWQALVDRAPRSDMFQTYEWITSWLGCFWQERPIWFLFVWDNEQLVGMAPLLKDSEASVSCSDSFSLPVNSHARRLDILCADNAPEVLEAIVEHTQRSNRKVRLTLRQSLEDSPISAALPEVARKRRLTSMKIASRVSPIVRIESTWDQYLATRPNQVSRELKRKLRKIERDWKVKWTIATTPEECTQAMEDVWKIERKSWKENAGTSLTSEEEAVKLYEDFARHFATAGWLRIYLLHLNGTPAAHILGAEFHGEYNALKTSYDADFKQASPGQALFFFALKDAFDRKLTAFDFLGDESRWKKELANAERRHVNVCAHSRFDAGCAWHTLSESHLKPLAKEYAPQLVALKRRFIAPAPLPAAPVEPAQPTAG